MTLSRVHENPSVDIGNFSHNARDYLQKKMDELCILERWFNLAGDSKRN
jgi:hypothetical protein